MSKSIESKVSVVIESPANNPRRSWANLYKRLVVGCAALMLGLVAIVGGMALFSQGAETPTPEIPATSQRGFVQVSAGGNHSLALTTTGELWAWGRNDYGQLGDGTIINATTPKRIGTATNWASVSAESAHSFAITTTGELWAWGYNAQGQLGDGTTTNATTGPMRIGTATNWASVSAGGEHSLAVTTTGELWAWGRNNYGQVGDGTTTNVTTGPKRIGSETNWASVSAGSYHSLAITTTGELWAWGNNSSGQVSDDTTSNVTTGPKRIGTATNWASVSAGGSYSIALTTTGESWAWGGNVQGQLGDGTNGNKNTPTRIGTASNWASVSAGTNHSLAITTTGELWAWGYNAQGQLGDGTATQRNVPMRIGTATNWASVSAGGEHSLAVTTTGELWAWGRNNYGQLGDGTTENSNVPKRLNYLELTEANILYSLANEMRVGDNNDYHEEIISVFLDYIDKVFIPSINNAWIQSEVDIVVSHAQNILDRDRTLLDIADGMRAGNNQGHAQYVADFFIRYINENYMPVFGDFNSTQQQLDLVTTHGKGILGDPAPLASTQKFVQIEAGAAHILAIDAQGRLWAWGYNYYGQLGDGTTTQRTIPTRIGTAANWASVSAGSTHSLALTTTGELWTWGRNNYGQIGDGTTTDVTTPKRIGTATNWASVSTAYNHSLAITTTGELWAWGRNVDSQLGDGTTAQRNSPTRIGTATNWTSVSAGNDHSLAINAAGELWAWGSTSRGRLGVGATTDVRIAPKQVGTATNWAVVSAGYTHSLALTTTGELWAWGDNSVGQVGDGTTTDRNVPKRIGTATNWVSVSAGLHHSIATNATGEIWAWGQNNYGQLGDGTTTHVTTGPKSIGTVANGTSVRVGSNYFSFAVTEAGEFWAWGNNGSGQLGDGTTTNKLIPTRHNMVSLDITGIYDLLHASNTGNYRPAILNTFLEFLHMQNYIIDNVAMNQQLVDEAVLYARSILDRDPFYIILAEEMRSGDNKGYSQLAVTEFVNYFDNTYMSIFNNIQLTQAQITAQLSATNIYAQSILDRNPPALESSARFVRVESGSEYSIALDQSGNVWTWGQNQYGQLGDNTIISKEAPIQLSSSVFGGKRIIDISAGGNHNLAIANDGSLYAWGYNSSGQIGNNLTMNVRIPTLINRFDERKIAHIAAGENHSLAIDEYGILWTWGDNTNGQLGDGTTENKRVPTEIEPGNYNGTPLTVITAGGSHSLAINELGELYAWGLNDSGQLGNGNTTQQTKPLKINTGSVIFKSLDAGSSYTLSLTEDGKLYAWGLNTNGQLGDSTTAQKLIPTLINRFGGKKLANITAGGSHSSAIDEDGHLWTWGLNSSGQLGNNSTTQSTVPTLANLTNSDGDKAVWISAGANHTVVADETGRIWAFGLNAAGQLGDSTTVEKTVPALIIDVPEGGLPPLNLTAANALVAKANSLRGHSNHEYTPESAVIFINYVDLVLAPLLLTESVTQQMIDTAVAGAQGMLVLKEPTPPSIDLTEANELIALADSLRGSNDHAYTPESAAMFIWTVDSFLKPLLLDSNTTQAQLDGIIAIANNILVTRPPIDFTAANALIAKANSLRGTTNGIYTNASVAAFISYVDTNIAPVVSDPEGMTQQEINALVTTADAILVVYTPPNITAAKNLVTLSASLEGKDESEHGYTSASVTAFRNYVTASIVPMITDIETNKLQSYTQTEVDNRVTHAGTLLQNLPDTFTLTLNINGDISFVSYTEGDPKPTELSPSAPEGYRFDGWFYDTLFTQTANTDNWETFVAGLTGDVTMYAHFVQIPVRTIVIDINGDLNTLTYTEGGVLPARPSNPNIEGSTFEGWFNNTQQVDISTALKWETFVQNLTGDVILKAKFTPHAQINFNTHGGTDIQSVKVSPTANLVNYRPTPPPTLAGHNFEGWFTDTTYATQFNFSTDSVPTSDITLHAKWSAKEYMVIYDFNGGSHPTATEGSATWGETYSFAVPTRDYWSFDGWFTKDGRQITNSAGNSDGEVWSEDPHGLLGPIEIVAHWKKIPQQIRFETDGGGVIPSISHEWDEKIPQSKRPQNPVKEFATFQGWFTAEGVEFNFQTMDMPIGGLTLYAKWTANVGRLKIRYQELQGYLGFDGFDPNLFRAFTDAMNTASSLINSTDTPTIESVKTAYEELMDAAAALTVYNPGEDRVTPPAEFNPDPLANNTWIFIVIGVLAGVAAAVVVGVVVKRKRA